MLLHDARGHDVAIETVDNGDQTYDIKFVPECMGKMTAKVFFGGVELPDSPYHVTVEPHLPVDKITVDYPRTGSLSVCLSVSL